MNIVNHRTIDSFCGAPAGSFKNFVQLKESVMKQYEQHRKDRLQAIRNNTSVPNIEFEMWMIT